MEFIVVAFVVGFGCLILARFLPKGTVGGADGWRGRCRLDELEDTIAMPSGPVHAALYRQSGNLHRDLGEFANVGDAWAEVTKSFRRAKVDQIRIWKNSEEVLDVRRAFHSHRGSSEGKKFGGAVIRKI